jgi:uncharacterized DUF497 family protein
MKFEWDTKKSITNERKHCISFNEAASVFGDPLAITFPDPDNSKNEICFLVFGVSKSNKLLVVSYTERKGTVRIISAREATRSERRIYEDG